jgi:hypothetical protein
MTLRQRQRRAARREPAADAVDDDPTLDRGGVDVDDGAPQGHSPHHDPSVHAERETFAVTTQRCRGEYP